MSEQKENYIPGYSETSDKQVIMFYTCFNGHEVEWGVPKCPICGATAYPKTDEPKEESGEPIIIDQEDAIPTPEQALMTLEQRNAILLKWLDHIQITNIEERKNCSDMLTNARQAYKEANQKKLDLTKSTRDKIEKVNNKFKPFLDKIDTGIKSITRVMGVWDMEQDRLAKEALQAATIEEINQETGEIVQTVTQPVDLPAKTIKSHVGSDTRREGFDVIITDPDLVPRQYCDPSLVKLRAGFKLTDSIPGAKRVPKNIYQTRVSR